MLQTTPARVGLTLLVLLGISLWLLAGAPGTTGWAFGWAGLLLVALSLLLLAS